MLLAGCTDQTNPLAPIEEGQSGADQLGAAGKAQNDVTAFEFPVDFTVFAPCVGEDIRCLGTVEAKLHTVVSGSGNITQTFFGRFSGSAIGQTSGTVWRSTAGLEQLAISQKASGQGVFHHTGTFQFVAQGPLPDLYIQHKIQIVTDPNGNVRVDSETLEFFECRGQR